MTRRWKRASSILALILLASLTAGVLVLRSPWLQDHVRARIIRELEDATGGRVEIAAFQFDWKALRAQLSSVVIHGLESPGDPPLFKNARAAVGLKIVSFWRRKIELAFLELDQPEVSIQVDRDGRTNLPEPRRRSTKKPIERIIDLAVGQYRVRQGAVRYGSRQFALEFEGRQLDIRLNYDHNGPAYAGELSARSVRLSQPADAPLSFETAASVRLQKGNLTVSRLELATTQSRIQLSGVVDRFAPVHVAGRGDAHVSLAEIGHHLRLPFENRGEARISGSFDWEQATGWRSEGSLGATNLAWRAGGVVATGVAVRSPYRVHNSAVYLPALHADALGGSFDGEGSVENWSRYRLEGNARGFALDQLVIARGLEPVAFSGVVSGSVVVEGPALAVDAALTIEPGGRGVPIEGFLDLAWRQATGELRFSPSHLAFGSSRIQFNGSLDRAIDVGLVTQDLDDLLPALAIIDATPESLPVGLDRGSLKFEGRWTHNRLRGNLAADSVRVSERVIAGLTAQVDVTPDLLRFENVATRDPRFSITGFGSLGLTAWKPVDSSPVSTKLTVKDAAANAILPDSTIKGDVTASVDVQGTYASPRASGHVVITGAQAWDESLGRVEAEFRYTERLIEIVNGRARDGAVDFTAALENEEARFRASLPHSRLKDWNAPRQFQPQLDGSMSLTLTGSARRTGGKIELTALDGELHVRDLAMAERKIGDLNLTCQTQNRVLRVSVDGRLREAHLDGGGEWNLTGTTFGQGQLRVSQLTLAALNELGILGDPARPLAVRGLLDAEVGFSGPVLQPDLWTGLARIHSFEIEPARGETTGRRLVLRNREPMTAHLDGNGLHVQSAHLIAEGTDLDATGDVALRTRHPWNLRLRGRLNLPALSAFEPDLLAQGVSTVDATIRGTLDRPQVTGRMEIRDGSFYLRGIPNGIEKATGTVVFDRTRANIDKLTAVTGGGELNLSGFIDFGGADWLYRLQGAAQRVRVRYPEAVSTTFDAGVNLTGTSRQSVLGGVFTIRRVGLNPRTDIASLLAEARTRSGAASVPNDFLRNMQLDLRVETSADAELQTMLARDLQPQAELRVRGTAAKPVLIGRIAVNQGEIQFFGNRYTITRGEASFYNPVKIDPLVDMVVETRVRGITVNISFTGPIDRLNVSYRSDPPLQSSEIIALLTVGRTPGAGVTPALPSGTQSQTYLPQAENNTLLGQAISAPINSRLQRLFGASRIKIDPELASVTNTPQARLTVEQQFSRDVTVTYITNLNRTQQQIVRLEWNLSRDFSMVAVRDDNGVFGVDFLWRKRFK